MSGDSTITEIKKDGKINLSPFKSRSTVICFGCLFTLIVIDYMAMFSGYFNVEFASLSIFVLREMIGQVFGHQAKADQSISNSIVSTTPNKV